MRWSVFRMLAWILAFTAWAHAIPASPSPVLVLTSFPPIASFGATVTLTATVTPAVNSDDAVLFQDATTGTTLGTVSLPFLLGAADSAATLAVPLLAVGTHQLQAFLVSQPDTTFGTLSQTIVQGPCTIALSPANPGTLAYGMPAAFTITVSQGAAVVPTGTVHLQQTSPLPGTQLGPTTPLAASGTNASAASISLAALAPGTYTLVAQYGGDADFYACTSEAVQLTIAQATPQLTLTALPASPTPGQTVTLTATLTGGATGTVTFLDGATPLGTASVAGGAATFPTTALGVGPHTLTAVYGGDALNAAVTSAPLDLIIPGPTSTTLAAAPAAPAFGQSVTLTATIGGTFPTFLARPPAKPRGLRVPTGSVTFLEGATALGTVTLDGGTATLVAAALGVGPHTLSALYGGDAYDLASSQSLTLTVAPAAPVLTWATPAPVKAGTVLGPAQLDATANVPGSFTYTPPAGTVLAYGLGQTLSVSFAPTDAVDYAPTTLTVTLDVTSAPQAITFNALAPVALGAAPFALGATASSGLPVSYASSNPAVATVAGNLVTLVAAGTTTLTATQAGDATWAAAVPVSQVLTVQPGATPPALTVSALAEGASTPALVLNICGTAASPNGLKAVTVDGVSVPLDADGAFSWAERLKGGANQVTVVATDATGLTTQEVRTVLQDATVPALALAEPADNLVTADAATAFSGTVTPTDASGPVTGLTYAVNGGAPQQATLAGGRFRFTATLAPGLNTVELVAAATRGAAVHAKRTVVQAPGFTLAAALPPEDLLTDQASAAFNGTVSGNASPVTVTLTLDGTAYAPAVVDGAFTQVLPLPTAQLHSLTVDALDGAGTARRVHRNLIRAAAVVPATYTAADVQRVLQLVEGLVTPTAEDLARYDLAPMVDGVSAGDGRIDIVDAAIVMDLASGDW